MLTPNELNATEIPEMAKKLYSLMMETGTPFILAIEVVAEDGGGDAEYFGCSNIPSNANDGLRMAAYALQIPLENTNRGH